MCIPVFNDWESAMLLLAELDRTVARLGGSVSVVLVDDGSTDPTPAALEPPPSDLASIEILHLRRNVGHQRAIALGLTHIHETYTPDYVVVMDGDGEDSPGDAALLLEHCRNVRPPGLVFARRRRRTETLAFRLGYLGYRILHRILTGRGVYVGNFSVIPGELLGRVVGISELWNHYAAAVIHAKLPIVTLPVDRALRLRGESKMNVVSLVTHGMSAISVYGDLVGVRLLTATALTAFALVVGMLVVAWLGVFTDMTIPGWASSTFGLLLAAVLNLVAIATIFVVFILESRNKAVFVPLRDYQFYVLGSRSVHRQAPAPLRGQVGDLAQPL